MTDVEKKTRSLDSDAGTHFSVVTFVWIQLQQRKDAQLIHLIKSPTHGDKMGQNQSTGTCNVLPEYEG
jgi:hypothetical protein